MTAPVATAELWRTLPAAHQPHWPDAAALNEVVAELHSYPPLVLASECDIARDRLATVARGEAFLLQAGDCAETFAGVTVDRISSTLRVILQMARVVGDSTSLPVLTFGRIAGQYAKPRSEHTEIRGGITLPSYRGDAVNGAEFTLGARTPDPARLKQAYLSSSATLNLLRALSSEHVRPVEFFTSHEALLLEYESALTSFDAGTGKSYDLSAHMIWIGERTRQLDGAHVEFASQLSNPIGVKLGPTSTREDVLRLVDKLDPRREPGRLTLIARMGTGVVRSRLPGIVSAVEGSGAQVVWVCDPMHGNTVVAESGHKTRDLPAVLDEVSGFFEVHRSLGSHPGGVHVELSGDDVTECTGGGITVADLHHRYETACDPRLNRRQSLQLAVHVAELHRSGPMAAAAGGLVVSGQGRT